MSAALKEPRQLTRLNLLGQCARIALTYGASVQGFTLMRRYESAKGCRDDLLDSIVAIARLGGLSGFMPTSGKACAPVWYARRDLTHNERLRREREARIFQGERFDMFTRRQAA